MKIQRLEIIGFKSFVERTVFSFEEGISAVLGPNGCGKSNVVDAIRWVMGEQSAANLRGQAMADVIFAGSESRRPHGMAEVSLVFNNTASLYHPPVNHPLVKDYAEIMVTRRLYRNGDSEYLLNKIPCRLKDITELFLDTGVGARAYSIIEQGKVASVLQARPEERRVLIEEAAGISKYKARRKTALLKIEAAQRNLQRVEDIIAEVAQRLKGLEQQAQKAREFRSLRQQLRELDIALGCKRWHDLHSEADALAKREKQACEKVAQLEAQLRRCGLELEQRKVCHAEAEEHLGHQRRQMSAWRNDLQACENEGALAKQQAENLALQKREIDAELDELRQQLEHDRGQLERLRRQRIEDEERVAELQRECESAQLCLRNLAADEQKLNRTLESRRGSLRENVSKHHAVREKRDEVRREQAVLKERLEQYAREHARVAEKLTAQAAANAALTSQKQLLEGQEEDHARALSAAREHLQQSKAALQDARKTLDDAQKAYTQCDSRLESLQELVENRADVDLETRQVLQHARMGSYFSGVLADNLRVEPEYEQAVAAVMGRRLQTLELRNAEQDIADVLDFLRTCGGRHVCQVRGAGAADSTWDEGLPLTQVAEFPPQYKALFFGVYLVDTLEAYLGRTLPHGIILVTRGGEILAWHGGVELGTAKSSARHMLRNRRRIKDLEYERDDLHAALSESRAGVERLSIQHDAADAECRRLLLLQEELRLRRNDLLSDIDTGVQQVAALEQELKRHLEQQDSAQARLAQIETELDSLESREMLWADDIAALQQEIDTLEHEWLEKSKEMQEQQQRSAESKRIHAVAGEKLNALVQQSSHVESNVSREVKRSKNLLERNKQIALEEQRVCEGEEERSSRTDVLLQRLRESKKAVDCAQARAEQLCAELKQTENRERGIKSQTYQEQQRLETAGLELQHKYREMEQQRQTLLERYQLDISESEAEKEALPADAWTKFKRLRHRVDNFGEVNLLAVEEYDALAERHEFLCEQQQDLQASITDLRDAINRINRKSRSRFKQAFLEVNERFEVVFPRLFSGGRARLILTDPDDMLATGIEIEACPPGKKLQNVNLLSGGEKALAAVALIFSIFQVKPSPFCLLDEVDAPLDHANIGRFNAMVKDMATASQFVIITHNTRTMEIADTLYGVTMEEPGVSRLVSVDIGKLASDGSDETG